MIKTITLLGIILTAQVTFAQQKTVAVTKSIMTSSFQTAFFIKNVDSLRRERLILDSLLRVNSRLLDTAYTRIDKFNGVIRYCNNNRAGCADSVNRIVIKFETQTQQFNELNKQIEVHIDYFNQLFPRITDRLQNFATENSTSTKTIFIDWTTYEQVNDEFIDWGNHIIRTYNLNVSNLNAIKSQINGAIASMRQSR